MVQKSLCGIIVYCVASSHAPITVGLAIVTMTVRSFFRILVYSL